MKTLLSPRAIAAVLATGSLLVALAEDVTTVQPAEAADFDTNAEPKVIQPAQINVSPALAEVVRLAQSGAGESVTLAYIEKAPPYHIGSDEIIYLKDLGISDSVLKALVDHGQSNATTNAATLPAPTNTPAAVKPPPEVDEFYQPLTPYGTWVEVAPYGWCWKPTVAVVYQSWQPYCDNGSWLWSDSGWYWHSYYSWGWAPFHYGRWFNHPRRGWCWSPDRVWGPSWVCWRNSPGYAGWAPLPPGARFSAGVGWTYHGRAVGSSFGFGIASSHFAFVSTAHFADRRVAARRLPPRDVNVVFSKTTVVNNYAAGSGNRVINRGLDRGGIESASGARVREVTVRELPKDQTRTTMPDRVTRAGNAEVVYRPGPKIDVPHTPFPAATRRFSPGNNRSEMQPSHQDLPRRTGPPSLRPSQPTPNSPERSKASDTTATPSPSTIPGHSAIKPEPRTTIPPMRQAPSTPAPNRPAPVPPSSQSAVRPSPGQNPPRATPPSQTPNRSPAPAPSQPRSRDDDKR